MPIAIGPVLIFTGQMAEDRMPASPWTLAAILAYAGLSAIGAMLRWIAPAQAASFSRQS